MKKLGFIGWRGMVGQVLAQRMQEEGDFKVFDTTLFSSRTDVTVPQELASLTSGLKNSYELNDLKEMDILISCQGGDYTKEIHPKLREAGWPGTWIDAASTLRMDEKAIIVLDPLNLDNIKSAYDSGVRDFIGGNCTVSLLMLALKGLLDQDLIDWVSTMTYQAASGAGARGMEELLQNSLDLGQSYESLKAQGKSILEIEKEITAKANSLENPQFITTLGLNVLPWIDSELGNEFGQTREEWKAMAEANKILGKELPIDGTCVRVGALRCHSQAVTLKMKRPVSVEEAGELLANSHEWLKFTPNSKEQTLAELHPHKVSGSLNIGVGRLRRMNLGDEYLNLFTVGDQLLWGAAEPLRRTLRLLFK